MRPVVVYPGENDYWVASPYPPEPSVQRMGRHRVEAGRGDFGAPHLAERRTSFSRHEFSFHLTDDLRPTG